MTTDVSKLNKYKSNEQIDKLDGKVDKYLNQSLGDGKTIFMPDRKTRCCYQLEKALSSTIVAKDKKSFCVYSTFDNKHFEQKQARV